MDARELTLEISVLSLIARQLSLETSTVTRQLESSLWKLQRSLWCLYCFLSGLECSLSSLNAPMALETRHARGGIHHSDRRVQYASAAYVALLRQHQLQISMSAKGNPYDNAFMESFYKTLIGYVPPLEFEAAVSNMKPADWPVLNL